MIFLGYSEIITSILSSIYLYIYLVFIGIIIHFQNPRFVLLVYIGVVILGRSVFWIFGFDLLRFIRILVIIGALAVYYLIVLLTYIGEGYMFYKIDRSSFLRVFYKIDREWFVRVYTLFTSLVFFFFRPVLFSIVFWRESWENLLHGGFSNEVVLDEYSKFFIREEYGASNILIAALDMRFNTYGWLLLVIVIRLIRMIVGITIVTKKLEKDDSLRNV